MNNNISWKEYFMKIAELSSLRSKDPKTKVGACLIDPKINRIVSIGYNGLPRGVKDDDSHWDDLKKHFFVVHAEANAILNTSENLEGAILYTTMFPCYECSKLLAQKGIKKIVYRDPKFRNKSEGKYAEEILKSANIEIEEYKEN